MLRYLLPSLIVLGMAPYALAESGKSQNLDWTNPTEKLVYYSCGCADSCWVADLRDTKTNASKIELRCDCEAMYLTVKGKDTTYQGTCQDFEKEGKFDLIVKTIGDIQAK